LVGNGKGQEKLEVGSKRKRSELESEKTQRPRVQRKKTSPVSVLKSQGGKKLTGTGGEKVGVERKKEKRKSVSFA